MSKSLIPVLLLGLTACTFDPAERIHADCLQRLETQLADSERDALSQDNAAARMIAQTMVETARSAGTLACDEMRDACKTAPEGPVCRAAKKTFD
jgi:hypothetical protein